MATSSSNSFDIISTIRSDPILLNSVENTAISNKSFQFYMVRYHQERMLASAKHFGWETSRLEGPDAFNTLTTVLHDHLASKYGDRAYPSPLMLRIAFSTKGEFTVTSNGPHPLPATMYHVQADTVAQLFPQSLSTIADPSNRAQYVRWAIFVTSGKVDPSPFTRHKTSYRRPYDQAFLPAPPLDLKENGIELQPEYLIVNERRHIMEGCRSTPYFWRQNKWITPAAECGGNLGTTRRWALEKGLCEEGLVKAGSIKLNEIIVLSNGAKGFQAGIVRRWGHLGLPERHG